MQYRKNLETSAPQVANAFIRELVETVSQWLGTLEPREIIGLNSHLVSLPCSTDMPTLPPEHGRRQDFDMQY
jgi:hypothetical protein